MVSSIFISKNFDEQFNGFDDNLMCENNNSLFFSNLNDSLISNDNNGNLTYNDSNVLPLYEDVQIKEFETSRGNYQQSISDYEHILGELDVDIRSLTKMNRRKNKFKEQLQERIKRKKMSVNSHENNLKKSKDLTPEKSEEFKRIQQEEADNISNNDVFKCNTSLSEDEVDAIYQKGERGSDDLNTLYKQLGELLKKMMDFHKHSLEVKKYESELDHYNSLNSKYWDLLNKP